jgi:hypothetical protein
MRYNIMMMPSQRIVGLRRRSIHNSYSADLEIVSGKSKVSEW